MPRDFKGRQIISRIANIEDNNYPYTDYRAPDKEITLRIRDQYSRHTLVGLNEFGLMMFQQFPQILGIRTADYMFDQSALGLETAQNSSTDLAKNQTAKISVTSLQRKEKFVEATVEVENLAGHGLPSGVAFRRVFITFEALDEKGDVIWASGRTNSAGAIVKGASDEVLPTEFFYDPSMRKQVFQPHYQIITDENQAQIYEELMADTEGKITTSFVGLDRIPVNDHTRAAVSVRVVLNYQSIPPYYLNQRFTIGQGPETKRLAYLTSRLTVEHTPVENWKLVLVCATRRIGEKASTACAH